MDLQAADTEASRWMKRGIGLLETGSRDALEEAVTCFNRALEIRRQMPLAERPEFNFGVAAALLNRGDALTRMGGDAHLTSALADFDEAIQHLAKLPLDQDPQVRRRVAIAWQNRGLTLREQRGPGDSESLRSFSEAIALLDAPEAQAIPDRGPLVAVVSTNLAAALMASDLEDGTTRAFDAAIRALALTTPAATLADAPMAEVALKARHVVCQAIARQLADGSTPPERVPDLVAVATDAVDEGLSIARHWERNGSDKFRGLAYDLVRFGGRVYRLYQPHFFEEFVRENLDPTQSSGAYVGSPEMRSAALDALWLSFRGRPAR